MAICPYWSFSLVSGNLNGIDLEEENVAVHGNFLDKVHTQAKWQLCLYAK